MEQTACPKCNSVILASYNFCYSCGLQLKKVPLKITTTQKVTLILISLLLPPLGLIPSIKYLKNGDQSTKNYGILGLVITIIITIIAVIMYIQLLNKVSDILNQQLNSSSLY